MLLSGAVAGGNSWIISILSQTLLRQFFSLLIGAVSYVLTGLGLYTAAKRRNIRHPWLAWIPLGEVWILGRIADNYQYEKTHRVCRRTYVLMAAVVLTDIFSALMTKSYRNTFFAILQAIFAGGDIIQAWNENIGGLLIFTGIHAAIAIIAAVVEYIALYAYYRSCLPNKAKVFLVLSILVPVIRPAFVFYCRKWDLGMPADHTGSAVAST